MKLLIVTFSPSAHVFVLSPFFPLLISLCLPCFIFPWVRLARHQLLGTERMMTLYVFLGGYRMDYHLFRHFGNFGICSLGWWRASICDVTIITFEHLRDYFPNAHFLLMTISDTFPFPRSLIRWNWLALFFYSSCFHFPLSFSFLPLKTLFFLCLFETR